MKEKITKIIKGILGFMKKHIGLCILLILIIAGVIAGSVIKHKLKNIDFTPEQETYTLEKRDIVSSVSASGKIVSNESVDVIVSSLAQNKILTMDVEVGDVVSEGDVLCTFDTEDIELDLADAKASLSASSVQSNNSVDQSERGLYQSQIGAVKDTTRNQEDIDQLQRILDTKKGELAEAERLFNLALDEVGEDNYASWLDKEAKGELDMEDSSKLNRVKTYKSSVDQAKMNVDSAEKNLETAKRNYEDKFLTDVISVENNLDSVENSKASNSVNGAQTKKSIRQLAAQIEDATVVAPISGVVTAVNYIEGNTYTGNAILTIEDSSSYKIEASVDEYDISDIKEGQRVIFKTNATGEEELSAVVSAIAVRATTTTASAGASSTSSTPSYKVTMDVTTGSDRLRLDMSAKINIIVDEVNNVFAVPNEAIQTDEEGKTYINVSEQVPGGQADEPQMKAEAKGMPVPDPGKKIYVTKGIESDYYTEISASELTEGMQVILPSDEDSVDLNALMQMGGPRGRM